MYFKKQMRWLILIIGFFLLIISFNIANSGKLTDIDKETIKIMPFVINNTACQECHALNELEQKGNDLTRSCDIFCNTCHKKKLTESHHKVGMEISFKIPEDIFLWKNRLACVSCHDLKNPRFSNKAWKCQSLFGRMFKAKSKYRTYYLVINNKKGKLCKHCH